MEYLCLENLDDSMVWDIIRKYKLDNVLYYANPLKAPLFFLYCYTSEQYIVVDEISLKQFIRCRPIFEFAQTIDEFIRVSKYKEDII